MYAGHSVCVVMWINLVWLPKYKVQLTTMPYWPRYFTFLGHSVRVVMSGYLRFYCHGGANDDILLGAIFYISGPQCTRCYECISVALLSIVALTTISFWGRYSTYLGHSVCDVMSGCLRFLLPLYR